MAYDCAEMDSPTGPISISVHDTLNPSYTTVVEALTKTRTWEPDKMRVLWSELAKYPDAGFVDIGCNIGPFVLQAAKQGRNVVAVDAVIDNILRVCRSVVTNGFGAKVKLVVNPVSDEHSVISLAKFPLDIFETTHVKKASGPGKTVCGNKPIRSVMVDDFLPLMPSQNVLMKIDVESFEFYVINGAKNFLKKKVHSIIMEWYHVKSTPKAVALIDLLIELNYKAHEMQDNGNHTLLPRDTYKQWPHDVLWVKQRS